VSVLTQHGGVYMVCVVVARYEPIAQPSVADVQMTAAMPTQPESTR
jgi:hypothetical protein